MTAYAEQLIARHDARQVRLWRDCHGVKVQVINRNLFGRVLVKWPDGNISEMRQTQFEIKFRPEQ